MAMKLRMARRRKKNMWFFVHDGVQYGPLHEESLLSCVNEGLLTPADEIWRDDMPEHYIARDIDGLFDDDAEEDVASSAVESTHNLTVSEMTEPTGSFQFGLSGTGSVTCPYCWQRFEPEDVLYIARHPSLIGDPVLGADEAQRFLPSRFTPDGHALDSEGVICPEIACPRCHVRLPGSITSMLPMFVSLVGAPGSGKSYFLASMCWKLRTLFPEQFMISFTDADASANAWISEYEDTLFVQHDSSQYQSIRKTELRGDLYQQAVFGGMVVNLPKPSIFGLRADPASVFHSEYEDFIDRNLILYDNAGEHFQPGQDTATDPGTQHLMHSEAIMVLFDPTKSPPFRQALKGVTEDTQILKKGLVQRQDTVLTETINRVRLHLGLSNAERYDKPVMVMISKADILGPEVNAFLDVPPWQWHESIQAASLNVSSLFHVSFMIRDLLMRFAPEVVMAVEAFSSEVIFMPVSGLGCSPVPHPDFQGDPLDAPLVVKPSDIAPKWVEVPLLYILFKLGYVCGVQDDRSNVPVPDKYEIRGDSFYIQIPDVKRPLRVPLMYAGHVLLDPASGKEFRVPEHN